MKKNSLELLQILNDVFTSIDKRMEANVGNEEENTCKKRFMSFPSHRKGLVSGGDEEEWLSSWISWII